MKGQQTLQPRNTPKVGGSRIKIKPAEPATDTSTKGKV